MEALTEPKDLCPYCLKPGPPGMGDASPPHYSPHAACEDEERRQYNAFLAADTCRLSGLGLVTLLTGERKWVFCTWGPRTLLSYAYVAYAQLQGQVVLGQQAGFLEPEWWLRGLPHLHPGSPRAAARGVRGGD